ncbi:hypothetical protein EI427_17685 [Flammeovirga pectinis]|uniref:PKD domain-containing protein n=1 Tax=Flammeovirga pectinis TaxID=2494373 RepID=A0A3S9P702_9BACT|nr:carbohydrate binding domain-containing protein [Flammeovirga pectinis]AZQ63989.1 hypothetical protein EI427_17685 [Flammeovirga pectinis]
MKNFKYIINSCLALLLALTSCTKEEVDPNSNFTDIAIFMSPSTQLVEVGKIISFADGSRGATERMWSINDPSYFTLINTTESKDQTVHPEFHEVGEIPVTLHLEFADTTLNQDTIVYITVLDSITADFEITKIEGYYKAGDNGSWVVEQGTIITYSDKSTGNPDTFSWNVGGVNTGELTARTIKVQYREIGSFNIGLSASRTTPYGRKSNHTKYNYIKVIKSTKPYNLLTTNPSFETGEMDPFTTWFEKGAGEGSITSTDAFDGEYAMNLLMNDASKVHVNMTDGYFGVEKGLKYTLEFMVRFNEVNPNFKIEAQIMPSNAWADNYKYVINSKDVDLSEEMLGQWQKTSVLTDQIAPEDIELARLYLIISGGTGGNANFDIDNLKFLYHGEPTN